MVEVRKKRKIRRKVESSRGGLARWERKGPSERFESKRGR